MDKRKFKRLAIKSLEIKPEMEENFTSDDMLYMVRCPKCGKENHGFFVALGRCAWCGHDEATSKQKAWREAIKAKSDEIKMKEEE